MKSNIIPAIKLTLVCIIFFVGVYALVVWGIGQIVAPNHGKGEIIYYSIDAIHGVSSKGMPQYGYSNIGQAFTADKYFWSRPSAAAYNATASSGSNKGPSNKDYLTQVQARIDTFMVHNPTVKKSDISVEMVTASGSGLDPDISPESADVQAARVAKVRKLDVSVVNSLIKQNTEQPFLGLFGPAKVNVLKLNVALDKISINN